MTAETLSKCFATWALTTSYPLPSRNVRRLERFRRGRSWIRCGNLRRSTYPSRFGFKIQYIANTGNIRHYYPDFVAVDTEGRHYLIETKGMEDTNVANKDRAANIWCANAAQLTGTAWRFVKVAQVDFSDLAGRTLRDVIQAFGRQ